MILQELKNCIKANRVITLNQLSILFQKEPNVIQRYLSHWLKNGKIEMESVQHCGSCQQCPSDMKIRYRWADKS